MIKSSVTNITSFSELFPSCCWWLLLRDLQKATSNFTTILGQGSFGPVYKAVMATGEVVAVKVLASDSRQGEREFQTEVCYSFPSAYFFWFLL